MASLSDINVLFALIYSEHPHTGVSNEWLEKQKEAGSVVVCRVVQMGVLRVLTSRKAMGENVLTPTEAWEHWAELLSDDRFKFSEEPLGLDREWTRVAGALQTGASVNTDTYLAAFAQAGGWTFVTFDKGFARFPDLSSEILKAG